MPRILEFEERSQNARPTRADHVVSKVFSILSPLVSASQNESLQTELLKLANSAASVWSNAQTSELEIIVSPLLERADREEWRSQQFDPVAPLLGHNEPNFDTVSRTRLRIMTLFPRVVARRGADPVKYDKKLPGSWPPESGHAPLTIETCTIHPGIGLPQWAPLVVRGKVEEEERKDYLAKALEDANKQLHSNRRIAGHGRRESMGSSAAGPLMGRV